MKRLTWIPFSQRDYQEHFVFSISSGIWWVPNAIRTMAKACDCFICMWGTSVAHPWGADSFQRNLQFCPCSCEKGKRIDWDSSDSKHSVTNVPTIALTAQCAMGTLLNQFKFQICLQHAANCCSDWMTKPPGKFYIKMVSLRYILLHGIMQRKYRWLGKDLSQAWNSTSMKSEYILPELSRTVSQLPVTSVSTVFLHYLEHGCFMRRMLIHALMSEQVPALGCI